jgi:hypothetical protein
MAILFKHTVQVLSRQQISIRQTYPRSPLSPLILFHLALDWPSMGAHISLVAEAQSLPTVIFWLAYFEMHDSARLF